MKKNPRAVVKIDTDADMNWMHKKKKKVKK